jgi:Tol biopolymer transport system component
MVAALAAAPSPNTTSTNAAVRELAAEVRTKGWICYASRSPSGDWDLFVCRPDGSDQRPFTRTPEFSEFSPQFSRDGTRVIYRRMGPREKLDNNRHGEQGALVLANADGSSPVALGAPGELTWASFSPDGKQLACLSIKGISFYDLATRKIVRTLPRKGFFQQLTWSPDGEWLVGVANSFGASWSIARMNATTGEAMAVNKVDCCTPDWFPDSGQVIFSWRPPGQKANKGYGWTQLWRADATGAARQLVYGEDGRHVYGGHVSPDGKYVLFTGNMEEDGDPGRAGAPMGLMRLRDGPIITGESKELRSLHPNPKSGPVLTLPVGWEPCWTFHEIVPASKAGGARPGPEHPRATGDAAASEEREGLAAELHELGWVAYSAKTEKGDWDLFLMRPDGSDRRPLTRTPDANEAGVRFSRDGKRLLYYRLPRGEAVDNNTYGTYDLVLANADGSEPVVFGNKFQWASWGPDGTKIACLAPSGIQILDVASKQVVRQMPRKGIVSQLGWSPDGRSFVGTANGLGPFWNIGCLNSETGEWKALSETERYNCTPDWTSDGKSVVYARGIIQGQPGRAELWTADVDGARRRLLYAEAGRHIYGACASPDDRYLLFTRSVEDLGQVKHEGTTMAIIRRSDAPMRGDNDPSLGQRLPQAKTGPRLDLGQGWEPDWTAASLQVNAQTK